MALKLQTYLGNTHVGDWLSPLLETASLRESEDPRGWVEPDSRIHPSSAYGKCPRSVQLGMLGHRYEFVKTNQRRLDNGLAAEKRWQGYMEKAGILVEANLKLRVDDPPWSGEIDVIIRDPATGLLHVGEIKTMNHERYGRIARQLKDREKMMNELLPVEPRYVYQLTQYLVMAGRFFKERLSPVGFFLFEDTDTQEFKIRWCKPDQVLQDVAFRHGLRAQEACNRGELLPPPFARESDECQGCPRRALCFQLQDKQPYMTQWVDERLQKVKKDATV